MPNSRAAMRHRSRQGVVVGPGCPGMTRAEFGEWTRRLRGGSVPMWLVLVLALINLPRVCGTDADQQTSIDLVTADQADSATVADDELSGIGNDASTITERNNSGQSNDPPSTAASQQHRGVSSQVMEVSAGGAGNVTYSANTAAAVRSPTDQPASSSGDIHWLLFTSWHMPLALMCVEIVAYCVTICIVFGLGERRSKAKRFGHFSWKRPNPFQEEIQLLDLSPRRGAGDREAGGRPEPRPGPSHRGMGAAGGSGAVLHGPAISPGERVRMIPERSSKLRAKKPSVRGHRP